MMIAPVLRDLGIDHQAGRFRRIPVMKGRFAKSTNRKLKLRSLRLPRLRNRLRLHRGGIQPVAMWSPRYRTILRQALGTQLGHHKGGLLDIVYDIHASRYQDPGRSSTHQSSKLSSPSLMHGLRTNLHIWLEHGSNFKATSKSRSTPAIRSKDPWRRQ